MLSEYKTVLAGGRDEFTVSRSRFIGWSEPVRSEAEAQAFIERIKKKHWDATHNVWAYVLGPGGHIQRCSDDGEPQGTAGLPALAVIRKEGLRDAAVVVTRYFGGIKLGAGGLVRAYTQAAKIGLEAGRIITRRPYQTRFVEAGYSQAARIQHGLAQRGWPVQDRDYGQQVTLQVLVPAGDLAALESFVLAATGGQGVLREGPEVYVSFWRDQPLW